MKLFIKFLIILILFLFGCNGISDSKEDIKKKLKDDIYSDEVDEYRLKNQKLNNDCKNYKSYCKDKTLEMLVDYHNGCNVAINYEYKLCFDLNHNMMIKEFQYLYNKNYEKFYQAVKDGFDINTKDKYYGFTPLHFMIQYRSKESKVINWMLDNGANSNIIFLDKHPLFDSVFLNSNKAVNKILNSLDGNLKSKYRFKFLVLLLLKGNIPLFLKIIKESDLYLKVGDFDPDVINIDDSLIHIALGTNRKMVFFILLNMIKDIRKIDYKYLIKMTIDHSIYINEYFLPLLYKIYKTDYKIFKTICSDIDNRKYDFRSFDDIEFKKIYDFCSLE